MSKKTAKKTTKKTTAPKKVSSSGAGLNKRFLHDETQDFYAQHPNVKPLLILFMLIATAVFIYLWKLNTAVAMMLS